MELVLYLTCSKR